VTLTAKTASGLHYSFGSDLLKKYVTDHCHFFLPVVGVPASMTSAKSGCYPSRDVATGTNFGHFKTFSVGSRCYFVMLSLHSFDLLYSSGLVVDSFRIVELLRICYGFVVQDVVEFL